MALGTPYDWVTQHASDLPHGLALVEWRDGAPGERLNWSGLAARVEKARAWLSQRGIGKGALVLLVLPNSADFVAVFTACTGIGAIPVPGPVPASRRTEPFHERLSGMVKCCRPELIVTTDDLIDIVRQVIAATQGRQEIASTSRLESIDLPMTPASPRAHDVAFVQFTSGSTSSPRGIIITHDALNAACAQAAIAYRERPSDVAVSWVPLFHDMGLITGMMRPLRAGYPTVLLRPEEFARAPVSWLIAIERCAGTLSSAPDYAYQLCTRKVPPQQAASLDLSRWRVARDAGEVVRAQTLERFASHFASARFRSHALCPSYGMAEATLTVTSCGPSVPPLYIEVPGQDLAAGTVLPAGAVLSATGPPSAAKSARSAEPGAGSMRRLVSSGIPVPDTEVRISGACTDGHVGEILIRGPQMSAGLLAPGANLDLALARATSTAWHLTGDLGFLWEGHLFVLGRVDDMLVVHGRNFYAADITAACAHHPAIRPGRVGAFIDGPDGAAEPQARLIAEVTNDTDTSPQALAGLARDLQRTLSLRLEFYVATVDFVRPGQLPVTTSGKLRVSEIRRRYLAGTMTLLPKGGTGLGSLPCAYFQARR